MGESLGHGLHFVINQAKLLVGASHIGHAEFCVAVSDEMLSVNVLSISSLTTVFLLLWTILSVSWLDEQEANIMQ